MRVGALDLSSRTGWGAWDGQAPYPVLGTKQLVGWGYDVASMLELYRLWLGDWIRAYRPDYVAVEAPFIPEHGGGDTILKQAGLFAFTMWAFKSAGVRAEQVHSGAWRKHFIGIGGGRKGEEMKRRAVARCADLGWEAPDHNAAEAGGILDWAIHDRLRLQAPWRDRFLMLGAAA